MSCPDYDGQRVFLHKPTGRKVKGLIRIMTMTEIQVKALHQWFGEEWESITKLSWRAMAEELLPGCGQGGSETGAEGQGCSGPSP